jgi:hypothetical protein
MAWISAVAFHNRQAPLIFPSFDSGHQQNDGPDSDLTATKPLLRISWNADGALLMAQIHFQTSCQKKLI